MAGNTYHIMSEPDVSFYNNSGIELDASVVLAEDTDPVGVAVTVGKGRFDIVFTLEAKSTTIDGTNHGNFYVAANTKAATTTWKKLGCIHLDADVIDTAGAGVRILLPIYNPYDNQIKLVYDAVGTTSITISAYVYPVV